MTKTVTVEHHNDPDADGDVIIDYRYAVRPPTSVWRNSDGSTTDMMSLAWYVDGTTLAIYDRDDIAGLRKLLDAIEAVMIEEAETE